MAQGRSTGRAALALAMMSGLLGAGCQMEPGSDERFIAATVVQADAESVRSPRMALRPGTRFTEASFQGRSYRVAIAPASEGERKQGDEEFWLVSIEGTFYRCDGNSEGGCIATIARKERELARLERLQREARSGDGGNGHSH